MSEGVGGMAWVAADAPVIEAGVVTEGEGGVDDPSILDRVHSFIWGRSTTRKK